MPTTFNVIYLGNFASIDPTEGNTAAENASILENTSYGSPGDPILNSVYEFSPGSNGFSTGTATAYDQNNNASANAENFVLQQGTGTELANGYTAEFDASVVYDAVITYSDGTTANITAVVFQDVNGNTFLAPEFSTNADSAALEAGPLREIALGNLTNGTNSYAGMNGDRLVIDYAVCFAAGTPILTPQGYRAVETLTAGDLVQTVDHGPQPLVWAGSSAHDLEGQDSGHRPIRLRQGAYGETADLLVSPQHMVLHDDRLVRAKHLAEHPGTGARVAQGVRRVEYVHLMCAQHELLIADGCQTESFYPGPMALRALSPQSRAALFAKRPGLMTVLLDVDVEQVYGPRARAVIGRSDLSRAMAGRVACAA
ncbi:hypothetical protein PARPLA_02655 [Rhodobacteraceae bacterium THAF1]|uniref:Hint domain-containing protein n=1 Tax=Palleronia sp. THAF1 TaxID=2587842 RepID=UPI000F3C8005|nr:Hint domain-containing protein [Palleronia sp. THAF1]QFU08648.1 hypothetical protein FIU81_08175 [Palleronia sp. THAF1]VDC28394.1 hypothetical protein PARPLA_02655 [Rhodobacteraceae bacterium THAF1]